MERLIEKELLEWKNKEDRKPLIVYGARQVGKSHTLLEFGDANYANVAYFFFENDIKLQGVFEKGVSDVKMLFVELGEIIGQTILPHSTLVIFDEIQACPAAITALKRIQETANEYHVACAGSLLGLALYRDKQNSFPVGKVDMLNMYPMNFKEFLMALGKGELVKMIENGFDTNTSLSVAMHGLALDLYKKYHIVGGMPECVKEYKKNGDKLYGFHFVKAKQLSIYEMYTNDMTKYCTRTEAIRIIAAFNSIPSQLAKENRKFQYSLIKSGARANDYELAIHWLDKASIVHKITKVNEGKMPLAGYEDFLSFKMYLSDVGLLTAKSNIAPNAILAGTLGGEIKGGLTENYVVQELVANGIKPYYWESSNTAELDFVIQQEDLIIPIEAKANVSTKAKSLDVFRNKYNTKTAIRISAKNFGLENGIKSVPLYAVWCIKK